MAEISVFTYYRTSKSLMNILHKKHLSVYNFLYSIPSRRVKYCIRFKGYIVIYWHN